MKNIFVVAHTESIHHVQGKVGGWYDTGLTELGQQQALQVAERLEDLLETENPYIISSDLRRAKETAEVIANSLGCDLELTQDLRELSYGIAEGKAQTWLKERISIATEDNRLDHRNIDGAESKREFASRVFRTVDALIGGEHLNQVVVTHGFAATFVIARWIGMSIGDAGFVNFRSSPGGITHLQQDDLFRNRAVRFLNDTSHLVLR